MRTLTAGSLSAALALVALYALCVSLIGRRDNWNDLEHYGVRVMSFQAAVVAAAGIALGWIGLSIGWKNGRRVSMTSVFGVIACYLAVAVSLVIVAYNEFMKS